MNNIDELVAKIRQYLPTLTVVVNQMYGKVSVGGQTIFECSGTASYSMVSSNLGGLLNGILFGLNYTLNLNVSKNAKSYADNKN